LARLGVRGTFSQPGPSHPAASGRLTRTLGLTNTILGASHAMTTTPRIHRPRGSILRRLGFSLLATGSLAGCFTVNDESFAAGIKSLNLEKHSLTEALAQLQKDGFSCQPISTMNSATCTKTRQGLHLYSCIERVNIYSTSINSPVEKVEVNKIVCAGL
jgi:hypothetical protein